MSSLSLFPFFSQINEQQTEPTNNQQTNNQTWIPGVHASTTLRECRYTTKTTDLIWGTVNPTFCIVTTEYDRPNIGPHFRYCNNHNPTWNPGVHASTWNAATPQTTREFSALAFSPFYPFYPSNQESFPRLRVPFSPPFPPTTTTCRTTTTNNNEHRTMTEQTVSSYRVWWQECGGGMLFSVNCIQVLSLDSHSQCAMSHTVTSGTAFILVLFQHGTYSHNILQVTHRPTSC